MNDFDFTQLSVSQRIELAQTLLDSVQNEIGDQKTSPKWKTEIETRAHEIESGKVVTIPWEQVKKSLISGS